MPVSSLSLPIRIGWLLVLAWPGVLMAEREPAEKPRLSAHPIESEIVVDGLLDEAAWGEAAVATKMYQYEPRAGEELSEDTHFRVLYDKKHLYLGVWCFDRNPDGIIARSMTRDFSITADDYLYFMFDTFHDQRNGYVFSVNPNAARYDALVSRGTNSNSNWNGVWTAKTSIDAEGWKAEIQIPFNSVSFGSDNETWGFNISRNIRRKSERGRWTGARPDVRTRYPAEAGDIEGLVGMEQGLGLEWRAFVLSRFRDDREDADWLGDAGMDLRYRLTPNLSATLSYNTDFAETEVDDRQVNLTRFPLFFPEKRAFFLEDSGIYDFGGLTTSRRSRDGLRNLLVPYFTRRIGLSDAGEIVPVLFADKIAGRIGETEVGLTHVLLDAQDGIERKNLFSGRFVKNFGKQSSVGFLATAGDPNSNGDSYLIGADYHFRSSDFLGDKFLQADLFAMGTETQGAGREDASDHAHGVTVSYPNEPLYLSGKYIEIGENFQPALGFVRRSGVRAYASTLGYSIRPEESSWLREVLFGLETEHFTDLSNRLDSAEYRLMPLTLEFASADELGFTITHSFDSPREDFEIFEDVVIPMDDYSWTEYALEFVMARKRSFALDLKLGQGQFYDGTRRLLDLSAIYFANKHLTLDLRYGFNEIDLPEGDFETHLASARMFWKFTPDLSWTHLLQYDSISQSIGLQSVLRWEYLPGSELFAVVNQSYRDQRAGFTLREQEFAVKVGATVRF